MLQEDVPSAFQPGGTAGAMRRMPSKSVASASLIASAVTPDVLVVDVGRRRVEPRLARPLAKIW